MRTPGPARSTTNRSTLSPRAALVLLGLFVVLGLVAWLVSGAGSAGSSGGSGPTSTHVAASRAARSTSAASVPSVPLQRPTTGTPPSATALPRPPGEAAPLRTKALYVLAVVDATGEAPDGYVGGRQFLNDGRGGTAALPRSTPAGRPIVYHEYDVNPKRSGVDRGPQRLVVGDDGSAYATGDHYVTWQRLR